MDLRTYIYKEQIFPEYCVINKIPFDDVNERYERMRKNKRLNKYSDDYLIDYIIRTFYSKTTRPQHKSKYYVGDLTATEFAKQNGMLPSSVKGAIYSGLVKNPDASTDELAISFVKRNKDRNKYTYENYPLTYACRKYHLSYANIMKVFYEEYPNKDKMTQSEVDAAIKEIVDIFRYLGTRRNIKVKELKYER